MSKFTSQPLFMRCSSPPVASAAPMEAAVFKAGNITFSHEQEQAILATTGKTLIHAGAGVGKTLCLVSRAIAIQLHNPGAKVLCLAFSKKAALEIKQRLEFTAGIYVSTFHSLCYHLLKNNGFNKFHVVSSQATIDMVIKKLIGDQDTTIDMVVRSISNPNGMDKATIAVRDKYLDYLLQNRLLTFGTLQYFALRLLQSKPNLRRRWCQQWEFVQVDEAQDMDYNQLQILMMIQSYIDNVCLVGDSRQQIFGFRGNVPGILQDFEKLATKYELTQNRRSNQYVIGLGNRVMYEYPALTCSMVREDSAKPQYLVAHNEYDEAAAITDEIIKLHAEGSLYKDMAILYRSSFSVQKVIEVLLDKRIPFESKLGITLMANQYPYCVVVNLFRAILMPDNKAAIKDILPTMYLKANAIAKLTAIAKRQGYSLLKSLTEIDVPFFHLSYIRSLVDVMLSAVDKSPADAVKVFLDAGLGQYLGTTNSLVVEGFCDELEEFNSIAAYIHHLDNLQQVINEAKQAELEDAVQIMSIHASKGLEWATVFICGCYEGSIPSANDDADQEEERRLFYVGITRAKEQLYLSMPEHSAGGKDKNEISHFIRDALSE